MINFDIVEQSYRNTHNYAIVIRNKKAYEFFVYISIFDASIFSYTVINSEITKLTIYIDEQLFIKNTIKAFYAEGRRDKIPESEIVIKNVNIIRETVCEIARLEHALIRNQKMLNEIRNIYNTHELSILGRWLLTQHKLKEQYNARCSASTPDFVKIAEAYRKIKDSEKEKPTNIKHVPTKIISFEPLLDSTELTSTSTNKVFDFRTINK